MTNVLRSLLDRVDKSEKKTFAKNDIKLMIVDLLIEQLDTVPKVSYRTPEEQPSIQ